MPGTIELNIDISRIRQRYMALGTIIKALPRLEEEDILWLVGRIRDYLHNQKDIPKTVDIAKNNYILTPEYTLQVVSHLFGIDVEIMKGRRRTEEVAEARQVAMYLLWHTQGYTLEEIGQVIGNRTPATVHHGYKNIAERIERDPYLAAKVRQAKEELLI